ncbi:MAG: neutral/alkaline non-lysosomal ceramidase N-terminal domain-containing protein [Deltaproteobacteria bacterium]|nr:neutral/alkaline non-lysosomal ceramidase N-terminal domain-containing protein [Deltaproteobacteria bacterium]MBW2393066.1 neutral/alkaline non-lysosomal ceramidase N-terminal domain-containing protein [Deltaproteobacteria bacterium]
MRAGTSSIPLPLEIGTEMMGYGARQEPAREFHDPLHARGLFLSAEASVLLVSLEVCLIAPSQAQQVATQIAEQTGLPSENVVVTCIHTHSGPDTGLAALLGGAEAPPHVEGILAAAVRAGVEAVQDARPARLGVGFGRVRIGRNRRMQDGPVDDQLRVLRVDDLASGEPMAVAYLYGCHPTVLGHDNLAWSADWPWAAGARIVDAFPGANPIFLLTAHADVDPRTRGLQDLAIPGQSVGEGFDAVLELGNEVGDEVVRVARETRADRKGMIGVASDRVRLVAHTPSAELRADALAALDLPEDAKAGIGDLFRMEAERTAQYPQHERRERIARVRRYLRDRTARRFAFGETPEVLLHVLQIGPLRLLAVPLEPTVDVGLAWEARVADRPAAVLSIAGGWMRYLPHPLNFDEPGADAAYEILQSTFEPGAAEQLLALGASLDPELPA